MLGSVYVQLVQVCLCSVPDQYSFSLIQSVSFLRQNYDKMIPLLKFQFSAVHYLSLY